MFRGHGKDSQQRQFQLVVELVCQKTGGPCAYIGRPMPPVHDGLGITEANWTTFMKIISDGMDEKRYPPERLAIIMNVTPKRGMHLYAPGKHDYQVVQLSLDPQPWMRPHATNYPASEIYHFRPLNERVPVFMKPFRLRRDVTLLATQEAQKLLAGMTAVTITGGLEYQACDDKVCFNPSRVPVSCTVKLKELDRRTP